MKKSEFQELEDLKSEYGFEEPNRGNLDDENIKWRHGRPVYVRTNLAYLKGKSKNHAPNSLERVVEDLVKTWEMEASHKIDYKQWETVDHENYSIKGNAGKVFKGEEAKDAGDYNALLAGVDKDIYDVTKETFDSSHDLFRNTFKDGFPWEVLQVFTGPPKVTFSWRHWGVFNGVYRKRIGDNEKYEMFGFCEVIVTQQLKIQSIEVYYKPDEFLRALEGQVPLDNLKNGKSIMGDGCPIVHKQDMKKI